MPARPMMELIDAFISALIEQRSCRPMVHCGVKATEQSDILPFLVPDKVEELVESELEITV